MTFDISPYYSVTVYHGRKMGPRRFKARAQLFRRDNQIQVGEDFFGVGGAMTSADEAALKEAQDAAKRLPAPVNWLGPQNGYSW
jgi:hypothetical protein